MLSHPFVIVHFSRFLIGVRHRNDEWGPGDVTHLMRLGSAQSKAHPWAWAMQYDELAAFLLDKAASGTHERPIVGITLA